MENSLNCDEKVMEFYYQISVRTLTYVYVLVGLMHGDMDQNGRNQVITAFKKKEMPVLIATDVAGQLLHHFTSC